MSRDVLLAGEGSNELGTGGEPGVLAALAAHRCPGAFRVVEALPWKNVRKYQAGNHRQPEQRTVLALAQRAKERGLALVFARDRDGSLDREREIESALAELPATVGEVRVAGAVAVERLESWVAASLGRERTESMKDAEIDAYLAERHAPRKSTHAMAGAVRAAGLESVPADAASLRRWLDRVAAALAP